MAIETKTFSVQFTEAELETIGSAMDDYIHHAEDEAQEDDLIGGIPVIDRVNSINSKIYKVFQS